mmetsp:Transcript_13998/g.27861  ORF Transcript_13998/g.27861 Transcript_13998/m.27861 type:complete len:327 (+) Transcript_13998:545-1525(+)
MLRSFQSFLLQAYLCCSSSAKFVVAFLVCGCVPPSLGRRCRHPCFGEEESGGVVVDDRSERGSERVVAEAFALRNGSRHHLASLDWVEIEGFCERKGEACLVPRAKPNPLRVAAALSLKTRGDDVQRGPSRVMRHHHQPRRHHLHHPNPKVLVPHGVHPDLCSLKPPNHASRKELVAAVAVALRPPSSVACPRGWWWRSRVFEGEVERKVYEGGHSEFTSQAPQLGHSSLVSWAPARTKQHQPHAVVVAVAVASTVVALLVCLLVFCSEGAARGEGAQLQCVVLLWPELPHRHNVPPPLLARRRRLHFRRLRRQNSSSFLVASSSS